MVDVAPTPPMIDARTLAAFAHCRNAGKILYLRQGEKEEATPDRIANLSYTPSFDFARLLEQEKEYRMRVVWWAVLLVVELVIVWLLYSQGHWGYALWLVLAMAPTVYCAWPVVHWYACIVRQIRAFEVALPKPLPDTAYEPVAVEWWSLVKAGFSPEVPRSYTHPEIGLSGRPWRVLVNERARQRIPVIQHFSHFGNQVALTSSYRLQLAASALLMEHQEGPGVDWGVVIDAKTLLGFAIPISAQDKERVIERLHEFREVIPSGHKFPIEPRSARVCRYCPLSYPRRESRLTQLGTQVLTPHLYDLKEVLPNLNNSQIVERLPELHGAGNTSATYFLGEFRLWIADSRRQPSRHSDCGDVFGWAPFHAFWESRLVKAYRAFKTRFNR